MDQQTLDRTIADLIGRRGEGVYWDFKFEHHTDKWKLVHDVLCLANAEHDGPRFLIFGVNDEDFSVRSIKQDSGRRTQTWTAPAREVERERTRQIARIGSNLNQIARWAHTHVDDDLAVVEVLAHLVAIERDLAQLRGRGAGDAG